MKIVRFFDKYTGQYCENQHLFFVGHDGLVYRDNEKTYESQSNVVSLENFIEICENVDWES